MDDIPDTGLHMDIEAPPETRAALAALAGVREVPQLSADLRPRARRAAGVHVSGRVQARVGQTCVVTLEPIENAIDEPVDVLFVPGAEAAGCGRPRSSHIG